MVKEARTPSLLVSYEESGPAGGVPVVLLHGWPYSLRCYDEVRDELAGGGFRVIVPELRGFGKTQYLTANVMRTAQQAALGKDIVELLDALELPEALLVGYDWGGRGACVAAALWPERVRGLVTMQGYSIVDTAKQATVPPKHATDVHNNWYRWIMQTELGVTTLETMREEFTRECWKTFSPKWAFTEERFAEQAAAFQHPDWVATTIQQYRWWYQNAEGSPELAGLEETLAGRPSIGSPTIALVGDSDAMYPPEATENQEGQYAKWYERRVIRGAGHCPAMESPMDLVKAVQDLAARTA